MKMRFHAFGILLCLFALTAGRAAPGDSLQELKTRMDKAAMEFKAMTAHVTWKTHVDSIDDNSIETGNVTMMKVQPGEVRALVEFIEPDRKLVHLEKTSLQIYYPKIKTRQVWDLGDQGEQVEQFVMIGFGTSGTSLAKDYDMTVLGTETVKGQQPVPAIRLQLIPKSGKAREMIKKLELWIPTQGDPYPIQEKISQSSGDYRLVIYSALKINPLLKQDAVQLKLPPGVKTEVQGK
jgi:outer membrane lipoprotein-sorting protein